MISPLDELARILARAYVRLLARRAEEDTVSQPENGPKPLDSWAETRPPCAAPEGRRT